MSVFDLILFLILLPVFLLGLLFLATPLFSKIPFVSVRRKVLPEIICAMNLNDRSVLYDLGCGDGRVLFFAAKLYPDISCVGVEKAPFPYLIAKIRMLLSGDRRVSILYGDMFKVNLSLATHVFLYLFPGLMGSLLSKLERELKPGTKVFSCDFQFSNKQPVSILDLKSKSHQLNRRLYVYEF